LPTVSGSQGGAIMNQLPTSTARVFAYIVAQAGRQWTQIGQRVIARDLNLSRSTAQRCIAALVSQNLIEAENGGAFGVHPRAGCRPFGAHRYRVSATSALEET
jgi:response regulator of citrate/malate metabolism